MKLKRVQRVPDLRGSVGTRALIVAAMLWAPPGFAQQAKSQAPQQLEEVVITAEKRTETVQQVPIAVSAFSGQTLQDEAIQDISGLARLTPGVNLDTASAFGGSNQILSASIRGIGQDDFAFNLDPGVGVYVDGIYYARTVGANVDLLDVANVDILKGPQGTLFGRNTIGGAIDVVTRTPGDIYTVDAEATTGSLNRHDFQFTTDLPISDTVLTSFTFSSLNRDGYQKRIPYHSDQPYVSDPPNAFLNAGTDTYGTEGGQGQDIMRGKVLWKAAPDFTITAEADWTHVAESSVPETLLATAVNPKIPTSVFGWIYNDCLLGQFIPAVCGARGPGLSGGNTGVSIGNPGIFGANLNPATYRLPYGNQFITGNIDTTYATGHDFDNMDSFGGAVTADWTIAPGTDIKSISGYRRLNWAVGLDSDGSPIDINSASFKEGQHQFSQELQLTGSLLDDKLKYATGLYYFNEGGFIHDYVDIAAGLLQIDGPNYLNTSSYAWYSHVDYNVIGNLTLILGARYSYDHKTILEEQQDLNGFNYKISGCYPVTPQCATAIGFPVPTKPLQYVPGGLQDENFYEFTPTLGLKYDFTSDLMAYFTYSKGFKDGGWTTRVTQPVSYTPTFGPEKAQTYEVGTKSEWFDHHLLLDLAGYYTQYDGIQLSFQEGESPTIKNAGSAEILGSELDGKWVVGDGLAIGGTAAYIDAYYTSLLAGLNAGQACVQPWDACITLGSKLPKTPKWKFSLSPEYTMQLHNEASIRFGVDYTHTSSMFNDTENTSLLRRPDTDVLNTTVTYISPDDDYEVVVGGTNITNDRYITTGNQDTTAGAIWATYNAPAEWFLTLRVKFQAAPAPAPYTPAPAAPTPTPPPPPPVVPEVARQFQVFFDFDKSEITEAAARVIQAAAAAVKQGHIVHITVTGHTDTVGSAAYNEALSVRRAVAVKGQLVADGVTDGSIATVGVGKTGLLVPTKDGVREAQNRRAVIELQ
jgi:iron complex outermembrane receptor protein